MRSGTRTPRPKSWTSDLAARVIAAAAAALACCGCVERTIEVTTDPPGARVFVDGRFAGVSPVEVPYTHYGVREVSAETGRAGSARAIVALNPPVFQIFPLDFVTDCLAPFSIPWTTAVTLTIPPAPAKSAEGSKKERDEMLAAARELRSRATR